MIRNLQKKFILFTMLSLIAVTFVLLAAINIANFVRIDQRAEDLLALISERRAPGEKFPPNGTELPIPPQEGSVPEKPWFSGLEEDFKSISITPETEFTTRWFSVTFVQGELISSTVDKIAAVSAEEAAEYGRQILASGDREGYYGIYKYSFVQEGETETVYFLNCENELQSGFFVLISTVLIGAVCLLVLFCLVALLSRRAVKPVLANMERQKRFITDAGHELKTPLAIISADVDVLSLTEKDNEWVDSIRKQTDRMGQLVQDLLVLAREEESPRREAALFNLSDAVLDTAMPFKPLAKTRGKGVLLEITPDVMYWGDEGAMRRLISVLMENALKYCDVGGEISLSLRKEGKHIVLVQKNPSTPLPSREETDHLFDRFYRVDPSRSRESGGCGIGLSIAKSIVEAHKGKICAYIEGNQLCFSVVL